MRHYKIAAIPADGIGPEVISAGIEVLHALTRHDPQLKFDIETFDWGSDYYKKHGVMMPEEGLNMLKAFDAIYFGAVGPRMSLTTSHSGACGCLFARALTSTPMCDPPKFCRASLHRCATAGLAILTGSSCAKTPKVNILVTAAVPTVVYLKKSVPSGNLYPCWGDTHYALCLQTGTVSST